MFKKYRKDQINDKIKPLGWEIPKGIKYKGMLENHAVKCLKCGWIQEKRLDNLIYRKEQCPMCGDGVFEESLAGGLLELKDAVNNLKAEVLDSLGMFGKTQAKAVNTIDMKSLFKRYIAKKGIQFHGRKMKADEWFALSHGLSEELMVEIASTEKEFKQWETLYTDLLIKSPTKQGQDILFNIVPTSKHIRLVDAITKRMVKL